MGCTISSGGVGLRERSITQNAKNFRVRVRGTRSASQVAAPTIEGAPALSEARSDGDVDAGRGGAGDAHLQRGGERRHHRRHALDRNPTRRHDGPQGVLYQRQRHDGARIQLHADQEPDGSHSSMFVPANGLTLNGGTITSKASGAAAALEHPGAGRAALPTAKSPTAKSPTAQSKEAEAEDEADRPTARFADLPQSHDGTTAFTVELHFSENIAGLSYHDGGRRASGRHRGDRDWRAAARSPEQPELEGHGQAYPKQRHHDHAARARLYRNERGVRR